MSFDRMDTTKIGEVVTCSKCGKNGKLSWGFPDHAGLVHKHYCSVKAKKTREEKRNKEIKAINKQLAEFDGWNLFYSMSPLSGEIFKKYPYKEVGFFDEETQEEKLYMAKIKEINQMIYEYMEEKLRYPTDKRLEIFIKQL